MIQHFFTALGTTYKGYNWKPLQNSLSNEDVDAKYISKKDYSVNVIAKKTIPTRHTTKTSKKENAITYLDAKIYELKEAIPNIITISLNSLKEELKFNRLKKNTQGWSIVGAGMIDIYGDFVSNEQQIKGTQQLYNYGYLFFYGLGFGLPLVLSSPPAGKFSCDINSYYSPLEDYGISYDTADLIYQVDFFQM